MSFGADINANGFNGLEAMRTSISSRSFTFSVWFVVGFVDEVVVGEGMGVQRARRGFGGEGWFDFVWFRYRWVAGSRSSWARCFGGGRLRWRRGEGFGGGGFDGGGFDGGTSSISGGGRGLWGRGCQRRRSLGGGESVAALGKRALVGGVDGHSGGRLLVLVGIRRSFRGEGVRNFV
jgi:hypothetical protein